MDGNPSLQERHVAEANARLPEYVERLAWPIERIRTAREAGLRSLVRTAVDRSPWHRKRLRDIDPDRLTEADLSRIPPMSKEELMTHFDDIVTDRRLTLDRVNAHLERLDEGEYLLNEFHVVASGGSSGRRGVFVYDWEGWLVCFLGYARSLIAAGMRLGLIDAELPVIATVAASHRSHMTRAVAATFSPSALDFPVTLPIEEIVEGLNRAQPTVLTGYASALSTLAREALEGRLTIAPRLVIPSSEPLLPEIRATLESAWHAAIANAWGTTEACLTAMGCGLESGMHLSDDLVIVEPVDERGAPVPPGARSSKVLLTNLFNVALPLIRYEITDEVTLLDEPCSCGMAFRRVADIQGRLDDSFSYANGTTVHPHVFRSQLGRNSRIVEYQVRQTEDGASIAVRCAGPIDSAALERNIADELARTGLAAPVVSVRSVDRLERVGTGKLKRFVPLP